MCNIYKDGTYLDKNPSWHEDDSLWKAKQIIRILSGNNIIPETICEIGCGAGEILRCLANKYNDKVVFSGYEISPQAYNICKSKETSNLNFCFGDIFDEKNIT